jgi:hypothetical protein
LRGSDGGEVAQEVVDSGEESEDGDGDGDDVVKVREDSEGEETQDLEDMDSRY